MIRATEKFAQNLEPGETLANLGRVETARLVGSFVAVQYRYEEWNIGTGGMTRYTTTRIFHQADRVVVL